MGLLLLSQQDKDSQRVRVKDPGSDTGARLKPSANGREEPSAARIGNQGVTHRQHMETRMCARAPYISVHVFIDVTDGLSE